MDILNDLFREKSVCFSGHRPQRLPGRGEPDAPETRELAAALQRRISETVARGMDTFINGYMAGFDILAAEQVVVLKAKHPQIRLISIAPFSVRYYEHAKCWTDEWIIRANVICDLSDFSISLSEHYMHGIYYERDRELVDRSGELICYWDGGSGGTKYTMDYARSKGLIIHNLCKSGNR